MTTDFCLVLILHNNANSVEKCLASAVNLFDEYIFCDNGSTDNTVEVVDNFMKKNNKNGKILKIPKGNDTDVKNYVFKEVHESSKAKYILSLEPNEVIIGPQNNQLTTQDKDVLIDLLGKTAKADCFRISAVDEEKNLITGNIVSPTVSIIKNDKLYYWKYPVNPRIRIGNDDIPGQVFINGIKILRISDDESDESDDTFDDYIYLLEKYIKKFDKDQHCLFYLGYYYEKKDPNKAVKYYDRCAKEELKTELTYLSYLRSGRLYRYKLKDYTKAKSKFMLACSMIPDRLEPFYEILFMLEITKEYEVGKNFISVERGEIKPNLNYMYIETGIYSWAYLMEASFIAHKIGNNELAIQLGTKLLDLNNYPEVKRKPIQENIYWYKKALDAEKNPPPKPVKKTVIIDPSKCQDFGQFKVAPFRPQSITIDNFFADPDAVREFALKQEYSVKGNYPGARTKSFATDSQKALFEKILGKKINYWPDGFNGSFQYTTGDQKSWIHRDMTDYSAIVYLTPNAPLNGGTRIYRHKESGLTYGTGEDNVLLNKSSGNEDDWDVIEEVFNIYNRCIIFDGRRSHKSAEYFGKDINDCRLFMIFFFNTE